MNNNRIYGAIPKSASVRETINYDKTWPNLWVFDDSYGPNTIVPFFENETVTAKYFLDMEDLLISSSFTLKELISSPFHIASSPGKFFDTEYFIENQVL